MASSQNLVSIPLPTGSSAKYLYPEIRHMGRGSRITVKNVMITESEFGWNLTSDEEPKAVRRFSEMCAKIVRGNPALQKFLNASEFDGFSPVTMKNMWIIRAKVDKFNEPWIDSMEFGGLHTVSLRPRITSFKGKIFLGFFVDGVKLTQRAPKKEPVTIDFDDTTFENLMNDELLSLVDTDNPPELEQDEPFELDQE